MGALVVFFAAAALLGGCGDDGSVSDAAADATGADASDGAPLDAGDSSLPRDGALPDASDSSLPSDCVEDLTPGWARSPAPTTEIYVSPSGDDGDDGTSPGSALATTAAAFDRLAPGVRLNFAAGTYDCDGAYAENLDAGTDNPAIILSSDGPRMARFDCGGGSGLLFNLVRGVIIDGIEVANTSGHGIQVSSGSPFDPGDLSSDLVILRSFIHDTGLACFKASQAASLSIHYSECARANPGRQMFEFVAVDDVILANNEGHSAGAFDEIKGGADGGRIYHNYVHDTVNGIYVGGDCTGEQFLVHPEARYEARNVRVWDNVMENVGGEAFRIVSCHDCTVANNTYHTDDPASAMRIIASGFAAAAGGSCDAIPTDNRDLTIVNNVFSATGPFTYMIPSNQGTIEGLTMTNNAWFAGVGVDVEATGSDVPFTGDAASLYSTDPLFASPPGDLSPGSGSPLIGAGVDVPFVAGGYDGCWDGAPNIGAY